MINYDATWLRLREGNGLCVTVAWNFHGKAKGHGDNTTYYYMWLRLDREIRECVMNLLLNEKCVKMKYNNYHDVGLTPENRGKYCVMVGNLNGLQ